MLSAPELVSLAASRGLSLGHLVPAARSPKRNGHDGVEWIPPRGGGRRPQGEVAAEAGTADLPWLAVRFSLAKESAAFWPLWSALMIRAVRMGMIGRWPAEISALNGSRRPYLCELAQLVLEEQRHAALFAAAPLVLRAARLGVSDREWSEQLARRYRSLATVYFRWLGQGLALVRAAVLAGANSSVRPVDLYAPQNPRPAGSGCRHGSTQDLV